MVIADESVGEYEVDFRAEEHEYRINGILWSSVTQILHNVLGNPFAHIPEHILKRASTRGKRVHSACHYFDENDLDWDSLEEEDKPYVQSWAMFRTLYKYVPLENEKIVVNPTLGYAGTLDKIGFLGKRMVLIDLKTGRVIDPATKQIDRVYRLQTAAYALANKTATIDRYIVQLIPGKVAKPIRCSNVFDFTAWKHVVGVHEWMKAA